MKKSEVAEIAAAWWASQIDQTNIDDGAPVAQAMIAVAVSGMRPLAPEKLTRFQEILGKKILNDLRDNDTGWNEDNPRVGSALRCVSTDWNPCPMLAEAAEEAEINTLRIPVKTVMWLDPDGVRIMQGHSERKKIG